MANKNNAILQDSGIERSILAGITSYGSDYFFEVEDMINVSDFYWDYNQELFKILSHLVHKEDVKTFDVPSIQAAAKILGYRNFVGGGKFSEYLEGVMGESSSSEKNIKALVATVYKFSLARKGYLAASSIQKSLSSITGAEPIDEIISKIEEPIFGFTGEVSSHGDGIVSLGKRFKDVMESLSKSSQDMIGLPTGFPGWDAAIGGGLRAATINVIGARAKKGKSFFCMNVAKNMAENGIPILYLDTELTSEVQLHRLSSLLSGVELEHVETGKFIHNPHENSAIWGCQEHIENLSIDHFSVAGLAPHLIMSIARRWLSKTVGFTDSGSAKPCLIIYDYIKLMDNSAFKNNLQEYQLLGFLTTALHNFAVKFKLPILATIQLNREGIDKKQDSSVVSGSDRIVWLCSNFTILKPKSDSDLNEDPPSNGTKKLIVTDTRYGPGMESGEYINIKENLEVAKMSEGKPFSAATQFVLNNEANEKV